MPLKNFSFGARFIPKEPAPPFQREVWDATAGNEATKPIRTLKRISLRWSIRIGVLSFLGFVGIPYLLVCAEVSDKAKGYSYIRYMNDAQRKFYWDNGRFAQTGTEIGVNTQEPSSKAYRFRTEVEGDIAFNYAEVERLRNGFAWTAFRNYKRPFPTVGAVTLLPVEAPVRSVVSASNHDYAEIEVEAGSETVIAIVCQANKPRMGAPPKPRFIDGQLACAPGTTVYD